MNSALFVQLMDQTETWYLQLPVKGLPERNKVSGNHATICVKMFVSFKLSLVIKLSLQICNYKSGFQLRVASNQAITFGFGFTTVW